MTELQKFLAQEQQKEKWTPIPLSMAAYWHFDLAHHYGEYVVCYAVCDWIAGILGVNMILATKNYSQLRAVQTTFKENMAPLIISAPYTSTNGSVYQKDFATEQGLWLLTQYVRKIGPLPIVDQLKAYIAAQAAS